MTTPTHREVVDATVTVEDEMQPQRVPVNAYLAPGAFVVVAPMPAVQADDIHVELHEGRLRFWAHLRSAAPREYVLHEWEYGGYEREVDVPDGFGSDVEANHSNGQLVIRVLRGDFTAARKLRPIAI